MVEITNSDEVKTWLEDKPRPIGVVLAIRMALRVHPLMAQVYDSELKSPATTFLLPHFRLIMGTATFIALPDYAVTQPNPITRHAAVAARAARDAISALNTELTAQDAMNAFLAASLATPAGGEFIKMFWKDRTAIDEGMTTEQLLKTPLWSSNSEPDWSIENWQRMRDELGKLPPEEDWSVWLDWWEDRRDGKNLHPEMQTEIALIPKEHWEKGPAHVNPMVRAIYDRYVRIESSPQPHINADGRLHARAHPTDDASDNSNEWRELIEQQRMVIRILKPTLEEEENRNAFSGAVLRSLAEYEALLASGNAQFPIGFLSQLHQIVRDDYLRLTRERYFDGGALRRTLLSFTSNHKGIVSHYPNQKEREKKLAEQSVPDNFAITPEFKTQIKTVKAEIAKARELVTEEYGRAFSILADELIDSASLPPTLVPDEKDEREAVPSGSASNEDQDIYREEVQRRQRSYWNFRAFIRDTQDALNSDAGKAVKYGLVSTGIFEAIKLLLGIMF